MKIFIFAIAAVAVLSAYVEAYPQRARAQHLVYYPPPTRRPRPILVRVAREVGVGGSLASNPRGGADARLDVANAIGNPNHNLIASAFAAGNTDRGPVTTGGTVAYNNNGLGAAISKTHTPGVRDTLTQSVNANLFNNGQHSLDANAFKSQNTLANGFKFDRNGAGLEYSHINGHGASLTKSNIPNFGSQLELGGKANLWSSPDRNTRIDLTGSASKWTSGPLSGQRDYFGGVGLTHMFGMG
ncbi:PREDICTED: attacin-B-like [Rhagoletis zephyria]|uniref:attacin-B-like n=1 Tax=Rhagoletis zephyria TaxID=28612 RepID=UPI0008112F77|nr:PREDICTED: attacin-B-like [Rhagoletis zephyria]XP_017491963.1 PREDICTED: attacin-B-like [Rhagoletis zephyria]